MNCNYCDSPIPPNAVRCPSCDAPVPVEQQAQQGVQPQVAPQPAPAAAQSVVVQVGNIGGAQAPVALPKSRTAYILLAFFFGGFGVHNFYAERTGMGIAQLLITLLSVGFLSGISAFGFLSGISSVWFLSGISALIAFHEIFTVKVDGKGVPMKPSILHIVIGIFFVAIACAIWFRLYY